VGEETADVLADQLEAVQRIKKPTDVLVAMKKISLESLQGIEDVGTK